MTVSELGSIRNAPLPQKVQIDLLKSAKDGDFRMINYWLDEGDTSLVTAKEVGEAFEELCSRPDIPKDTLEKLAKLSQFRDVRFPYIPTALLNAIQAKNEKAVELIVTHPQMSQDLDDLYLPFKACFEVGSLECLRLILGLNRPPKEAKELLLFTIEKNPFEYLEELLKHKAFRDLFEENIDACFVKALSRPSGYIRYFFDRGYLPNLETLSDQNTLTIWEKGVELEHSLVGQQILKFIAPRLLCCDAYTDLKEDYGKLSVNEWLTGARLAITRGKQTGILWLFTQTSFLTEIPPATREELLEKAWKTSGQHPYNVSVVKALMAPPPSFNLPPISSETLEKCLILTGKEGLAKPFETFSKMDCFQKIDGSALCSAFVHAGQRGHFLVVKLILECSRAKEITSREFLSIFTRYEVTDALPFLIQNMKGIVTPADLNQIFIHLVEQTEEDLLTLLVINVGLDAIERESMETVFAPLLSLGKRLKEGDSFEIFQALFRENCPKALKLRYPATKIAEHSRFKTLFSTKNPLNQINPDLSAILIAAAGLGFLTVAQTILATRDKEIDPLSLEFAAIQSCANSSYFAISEKKSPLDFELKTLPLLKREEKGLIFIILISYYPAFGDFGNKEVYSRLQRLLFLAVESGGLSQVTNLLKHTNSGQGSSFTLLDRIKAKELAIKHNHPEIAALFG
jgi:hypothetical protein